MNRVVHFEIYATNPPETIAFYKQVFGWKIDPGDHQKRNIGTSTLLAMAAMYHHPVWTGGCGGGEVHRLWKAVALMHTPAQSKLRISTLHLKRS
jgi:hypothetical protein